jgi:hypothetical protein
MFNPAPKFVTLTVTFSVELTALVPLLRRERDQFESLRKLF